MRDGDDKADSRIAGQFRRILGNIRGVVGAPDYEAYLEHCRRAGHSPRLTEREYVQAFFDAKGSRPRCC